MAVSLVGPLRAVERNDVSVTGLQHNPVRWWNKGSSGEAKKGHRLDTA